MKYPTRILIFGLLLFTLLSTGAFLASAAEEGEAIELSSQPATALLPPNELVASELDDKRILLTWDGVHGATQYRVYRSQVQGTYPSETLIHTLDVSGWTEKVSYTDSSFAAGIYTYYYVVTAVNASAQVSGFSNEASGLPHYAIPWAGTVFSFPSGDMGGMMTHTFTYTLGTPSWQPIIAGELLIPGRTGVNGPEPDVWAQFGFGPAGDHPETEFVDLTQWTDWQDAEYFDDGVFGDVNSRYIVHFLPEKPGNYYFTYRFSTTGGREWTYPIQKCDGRWFPDPKHVPGNALCWMQININQADVTPPEPPLLTLDGITATTASLSWTESTSPDLYAYDLYRSLDPASPGQRIGRVLAGGIRAFIDEGLVSGTPYSYRVIANDTSFNGAESNRVDTKTSNSLISFQLQVSIPEVTPGPVYINRSFDPLNYRFGDLNWTGVPLNCNYTNHLCTVELTIQENTTLHFSFSRGSKETVQTQFDGNSPAIDPSFKVTKGLTIVHRSIANWEDPFVTNFEPQGSGISPFTNISITWNQAMPPTTVFSVNDLGKGGGPAVPVPGAFTYVSSTHTLTFTPAEAFGGSRHYEVKVKDQQDLNNPAVGQVVEKTWTFITRNFYLYAPIVVH